MLCSKFLEVHHECFYIFIFYNPFYIPFWYEKFNFWRNFLPIFSISIFRNPLDFFWLKIYFCTYLILDISFQRFIAQGNTLYHIGGLGSTNVEKWTFTKKVTKKEQLKVKMYKYEYYPESFLISADTCKAVIKSWIIWKRKYNFIPYTYKMRWS